MQGNTERAGLRVRLENRVDVHSECQGGLMDTLSTIKFRVIHRVWRIRKARIFMGVL